MEFKIIEYEGLLVTESRQLAEIVDKQHKDLLRDIRNYIKALEMSADLLPSNYFIEGEYIDSNNRMKPCYLVTELGCSLVAQKMTGTKGILFSANYAAKFKEMEEKLKNPQPQYQLPMTYKEALVQLVEQVELNEQITKELKVAQPKAQYLDDIVQNSNLLTITQIAKDYGMSGARMNELLHEKKIQFKSNNTWLLYSKYQDKGYTHSSSGVNHGQTFTNTKWTQEGKKFLYELLKKDGVSPKIEQQGFELQMK